MPLDAPDDAGGRAAYALGAGAALLGAPAAGRVKGAGRRRVDGLVAVVPPDSVSRRWLRAEDLLDHAHTLGSLRRLRLGGDAVSYLQLHLSPPGLRFGRSVLQPRYVPAAANRAIRLGVFAAFGLELRGPLAAGLAGVGADELLGEL